MSLDKQSDTPSDKSKEIPNFKLSVLNQMLILALMLVLLGGMYYVISGLDEKTQTSFEYSIIGANVHPNQNNVTVELYNSGNYTFLFEYSNETSKNVIIDCFSLSYEINNATINYTYTFDITNKYDTVFLIIRNNDTNFSEGHKID